MLAERLWALKPTGVASFEGRHSVVSGTLFAGTRVHFYLVFCVCACVCVCVCVWVVKGWGGCTYAFIWRCARVFVQMRM